MAARSAAGSPRSQSLDSPIPPLVGSRGIRKLARESRLLSSQSADAVPFNGVDIERPPLGRETVFWQGPLL
jgi:hypothetical protein